MRSMIWIAIALAAADTAGANEVTVKNDSLVNNSSGNIQAGFAVGEKAAAWLTSPCDGNIVAAQVFWRSLFGGAPQIVQESVEISTAGAFPVPGTIEQTIQGPVLTDGVINEYRYLDENNTIPLIIPVAQDETFVVALTFAEAPDPSQGPSVVSDTDGIEPNRNAIYADIGGGTFQWFSSSTLGVNGDWVIRAVVDCQTGPSDADVGLTMAADPPQYTAGAALTFIVTVANAGPAAAMNTTVVDTFPAAYTGVTWTCVAGAGASCTSGGSGNIAQAISLGAGSEAVFTVHGTVAPGTTGSVSNSATAVVGAPATDPDTGNNSVTLDIAAAADDLIFGDGFELPPASVTAIATSLQRMPGRAADFRRRGDRVPLPRSGRQESARR